MKKELIIRVLKEVIATSKMETCNFGEDTKLIKERTELWRQTWIIAPLENVLEEVSK